MSFEPGLAVGDTVSFFVNLASMNKKDGDDAKDISGKRLNLPYGPAEGVIKQLIDGGDKKVIMISINEDNFRKAKLQEYYFNNTAHIVAHMLGEENIPPAKIFYEPRAYFTENPYEIIFTEELPNPEGKRIVTKITSSTNSLNPFAAGGGGSSSSAAGGGTKLRRTRRRSTRRSTRLRTNRR
jgi:hypothetical protein